MDEDEFNDEVVDDDGPPTTEEEVYENLQKLPKPAVIVALIGVIIVTATAIAALAYNAVVHGGSTDGLTTLAGIGLGGLIASFGSQQKHS